jgi:heterogeneous nuclear ribonucleoprotein K
MIVKLDRIIDCFTEVLAKLAEEQRREKTPDLDVRLLVHHSHAGAIIGRGGSKIKELREQTRSQIKVHQECCPNSTDRVVQINTSQENMPDVVKALIDFMREIPIKGAQKPYDSACYDPRMAFAYGSYAVENPGPGFPSGRGPRMPGPPPYPNRMPVPGMNYGMPPRMEYPVPAPPMAGVAPPPNFAMGAGMQQTQVQVTIPNELGGTIIGKGCFYYLLLKGVFSNIREIFGTFSLK